jgi:amidase
MAVRPPSKDQLAVIARGYGMHLSEADLGSFEPLVGSLLASYDAVEELYEQTAPEPPAGRIWKRPEPAENPLGAWYVITEIQQQPDGPLAGRRVAVKDNIEVAGVPMMNGSYTLEGFVPSRDATVVTRLLAAGATITGKSVCEDLCFSGASHTSVTGPVRNPWDTSRTTGGSSSGSAALVATGKPISRWAETRAVRCGSPARGAGRSVTSRLMAWSRTPGRSRSSSPSITSARSPAPWPMPR